MLDTHEMVDSTKDVTNLVVEAERVEMQARWDAAGYMSDYFTLNLNADSGNTTLQLPYRITSDTSIRLATATIKGKTYSGTLRNFAGVSVRASGIEYSGGDQTLQETDLSKKAFVVDFGGMRKVSALRITGNLSGAGLKIMLVLPWMGIEFGEKPLFPLNKKAPELDTTGKTLVNFPETETAKLFIQLSDDVSEPAEDGRKIVDEVLDFLVITSNTYPLNVRVAIADRPPFFMYAGEMTGEQSLPDFSTEVNAYLDELTASGVTSVDNIPLTVTTDLPGVITLEGHQLFYDRVSTAKWNESVRLPINFLHQDEKEVILEFPASENYDWQINGLNMEITHDFPEWRTFPRLITDVSDNIVAKVAPDINIAQCITVNESTELHGISLFLTGIKSNAELSLEVVEDLNGLPGNTVLNSEIIEVPITSQVQWFDVFFSKPLKTSAGKNIWFITKTKIGSAGIVLEHAGQSEENLACFDRHGAGWKKFPYKQGQVVVAFRHLRKPASGEDARVVEMEVCEEAINTDLIEEVNTVTFPFFNKETGVSTGPKLTPQDGKAQLKLKITAHAAGTMILQNVKILYQTTSVE
jgi:hypothetical protein